MDLFWIWATVGSLFLLAEIFIGSHFFLFFIALAFYSSALVLYAFPTLSYSAYLFVTVVFLCVCPAIWFYFFRPYFKSQEKLADVNHALIGLKGTVIILDKDMQGGRSKVKIKHSLWEIKTPSGENFKKGQKVMVTNIEGVTLIVKEKQ